MRLTRGCVACLLHHVTLRGMPSLPMALYNYSLFSVAQPAVLVARILAFARPQRRLRDSCAVCQTQLGIRLRFASRAIFARALLLLPRRWFLVLAMAIVMVVMLCVDIVRRRFRILPLHSQIRLEQQREVFEKPPAGVRKVVFFRGQAPVTTPQHPRCRKRRLTRGDLPAACWAPKALSSLSRGEFGPSPSFPLRME